MFFSSFSPLSFSLYFSFFPYFFLNLFLYFFFLFWLFLFLIHFSCFFSFFSSFSFSFFSSAASLLCPCCLLAACGNHEAKSTIDYLSLLPLCCLFAGSLLLAGITKSNQFDAYLILRAASRNLMCNTLPITRQCCANGKLCRAFCPGCIRSYRLLY